jgi:hypothetical protein
MKIDSNLFIKFYINKYCKILQFTKNTAWSQEESQQEDAVFRQSVFIKQNHTYHHTMWTKCTVFNDQSGGMCSDH